MRVQYYNFKLSVLPSAIPFIIGDDEDEDIPCTD